MHTLLGITLMTSFFVLFGWWLAFRMPTSEQGVRCLRATDPALEQRVEHVIAARAPADTIPSWLGWVAGIFWIAEAPLVAIRVMSPGIAYGVGCLAFAVCLAVAYLFGRSHSRRRAAVLTPRKTGASVPVIWYVLTVVAAVAVLAFAAVPSLRFAAILSAGATLVVLALALLASGTPAVLIGDDLPVEQVVDDRVRFSRTSRLLALALVQPFLFCIFAWASSNAAVGPVLVLLTFLATASYSIWLTTRTLAPIRLEDIAPVVAAR